MPSLWLGTITARNLERATKEMMQPSLINLHAVSLVGNARNLVSATKEMMQTCLINYLACGIFGSERSPALQKLSRRCSRLFLSACLSDLFTHSSHRSLHFSTCVSPRCSPHSTLRTLLSTLYSHSSQLLSALRTLLSAPVSCSLSSSAPLSAPLCSLTSQPIGSACAHHVTHTARSTLPTWSRSVGPTR